MRKKLKWVIAGIVLIVAGGLFFLTREPEPPYAFLKKYPIVRSSVTAEKERMVVLKGDFEDVEADISKEIGSGVYTFSSAPLESGDRSRYALYFSKGRGAVTLTDDISEPDPIKRDGFILRPPRNAEVRKGFCSVTYEHEPSPFGRFITWIKGLFGDKEPQKSVSWNEIFLGGKRAISVKP